jgi:hypothetical protein
MEFEGNVAPLHLWSVHLSPYDVLVVELLQRSNLSQRALRQPPTLALHLHTLHSNNLVRPRVARFVWG